MRGCSGSSPWSVSSRWLAPVSAGLAALDLAGCLARMVAEERKLGYADGITPVPAVPERPVRTGVRAG